MTTIAIDTETTGPFFQHGCLAFMVTACDEDGFLYKWEWPVDPFTREVEYLSSPGKKVLRDCFATIRSYDTWVFHNALFDLSALSIMPFPSPFLEFEEFDIHDTMVMAHCHNSLDRLGLKGLALQYLKYSEADEKELHKAVTKARRIAKKLNWALASPDHHHLTPLKDSKGHCDYWLPQALIRHEVEMDEDDRIQMENVCGNYAIGDVERTMGLFLFFRTILKSRGDYKHYDQNRRCLLPIWEMQQHGLTINHRKTPKLLHTLGQHRAGLHEGMRRLSLQRDFNPRSTNDVQTALFDTLKIDPRSFTKTGTPSTDKDALKEILDRDTLTSKQEIFVKRLLTYRKLTTADSYLQSYQRYELDSKLYTNLNVVGTITLRLASRNPNTQNISKQENDEDSMDVLVNINLRSAFGPPKGHLWVCIDYAQLQLRIFAHACQDEYLIHAFQQGLDIHDTVARKVFQTEAPSELQRRAAKAINFGIIFGAGKRKIDRMSGVDGSFDEFKRQFPLVDRYLKASERQAKKMGYIRTLGGYPLRVQRATAYKACNLIVQGTEGEMVKEAINLVSNYCGSPEVPIVPIMTIHDEIIFQTKHPMKEEELTSQPSYLEDICNYMNLAGEQFGVKTSVDMKLVTNSWATSKKLSFV